MEGLTKQTIEKIQELVESRNPVIQLDDDSLLLREDYRLKERTIPRRSTLETNSLNSLIDFVKYTISHEDQVSGYLIEVVDECKIVFYEPVDKQAYRNALLRCVQDDKARPFLNRYISPEEMIINLRRVAFEGARDYDVSLRIISGISKKQEVQTTDDGIGQTTTLVQGNTIVGSVEIKSMPTLRLQRTFNELSPIAEQFVLRVKDGNVALFTANSNLYVYEYRNNIRDFIKNELQSFIDDGILLVI